MSDLPAEQRLVDPEHMEKLSELSERIGSLVARSSKVWAESLDRQIEDIGLLRPDPLNAVPSVARFAYDYVDHPHKAAQAMVELWAGQADLWTRTVQRAWFGEQAEPVVRPARSDRRFKDPAWEESPFFDYLKQSYLLTGEWLKARLAEADGLSPHDRRKLELVTRNYIEAVAPSNSPMLNPEVLTRTIEEKGENLLRGIENLLRDLERGHGQLLIQQTDMSAFRVGENMANTPGEVIFENNVMQLIQYAPTTAEVRARPLLICPPWINKFYILDLNEKKSMMRWLVDQGLTVFVISWINPGPEQAHETWESYMTKGVLTAIDRVREECGVDQVDLTGYCIGGTMVGTTLAYLAAQGDERVASATFFTAQLDFSDAGELQAFVDEDVLESLEEAVEEKGYLAAENMFAAFNSLRSADLVWGFVINNYLLGKDNFPFDLLYWNSDSTRMPGRVHVFYLDEFYNRNTLARGGMVLDGIELDLGKVTLPCYHVATIEDHIAPAPSAYRAARALGSEQQSFILSGSGHIAGVVNPPASGKYQYWTRPGVGEASLERWRADAAETPGSWWPHWRAWLESLAADRVPARAPGAVHGRVEPAPGRYVKTRFDEG